MLVAILLMAIGEYFIMDVATLALGSRPMQGFGRL